jgi:hypothetical protein
MMEICAWEHSQAHFLVVLFSLKALAGPDREQSTEGAPFLFLEIP